MGDSVVFKGRKNGLQLIINESVEFEEIVGQLKAKLEAAADFFSTGAAVQVPSAERLLSPEQQNQLQQVFSEHGLIWQESTPAELPAGSGQESQADSDAAEKSQTLIVARTIRGGQEVTHSGMIVILGDVNPGAKVVAGGDIVIHGACRGVVHAGAFGDTSATITANQLLASQIRIAGLIARAPDHLDKPAYVETARIQNGIVLIEPAK
ncbi:MAG: septum site-determining protein MinC [Veillonellales bacterium]